MPRVVPIISISKPENETVHVPLPMNLQQSDGQIVNEKAKMARRAEERHMLYEDILNDTHRHTHPSHIGLYGLGGILFGISVNTITALIPIHDVIKHPQYFYEDILTEIFFNVIVGMKMALENSYVMNLGCLRNFKHCAKIVFGTVIARLLTKGALNFIWIYIGGNRYPMPFHTNLDGLALFLLVFILIWSQFPEEFKSNKIFRKRFWYYMLQVLMNILINIEYQVYSKVIMEITPEYQWIVVGTLPLARELNICIQTKISFKAAASEDFSVEFYQTLSINTAHCVFLSTVLGSQITNLSTWLIVGMDLLINLCIAIRIIWLKKENKFGERTKDAELQLITLVTVEMVETVVPVTFLICLLMSYYGPNSELIGGVGSSHFHFTPIENIGKFVENLGLFFAVEAISVTITGFSLWIVSRINVIRAYLCLLDEFRSVIAIVTGYYVLLVSFIFINIRKCLNIIILCFQ